VLSRRMFLCPRGLDQIIAREMGLSMASESIWITKVRKGRENHERNADLDGVRWKTEMEWKYKGKLTGIVQLALLKQSGFRFVKPARSATKFVARDPRRFLEFIVFGCWRAE